MTIMFYIKQSDYLQKNLVVLFERLSHLFNLYILPF